MFTRYTLKFSDVDDKLVFMITAKHFLVKVL